MQIGAISRNDERHQPRSDTSVVSVKGQPLALTFSAKLHRCIIRGGALHLYLISSSRPIMPFFDLSVRSYGLDYHLNLSLVCTPVIQVAGLYVLSEVVDDILADCLPWWMHVKRIALNVNISSAFFLHLLQNVKARCAVDGKLLISPAVAAVNLVTSANAFYYELEKIFECYIGLLLVF